MNAAYGRTHNVHTNIWPDLQRSQWWSCGPIHVTCEHVNELGTSWVVRGKEGMIDQWFREEIDSHHFSISDSAHGCLCVCHVCLVLSLRVCMYVCVCISCVYDWLRLGRNLAVFICRYMPRGRKQSLTIYKIVWSRLAKKVWQVICEMRDWCVETGRLWQA